jgi:outer membrane protein TolC
MIRSMLAVLLVLSLPSPAAAGEGTPELAEGAGEGSRDVQLTFDDLVARVAARRATGLESLAPGEIRNAPSIRFETGSGISRTQNLFFETPYESRQASAVVAVDYPLFDRGARRIENRIAVNETEQARQSAAMTDSEFETLLEAYSDLWLASSEVARTDEVSKQVIAFAGRAPELLQQGRINNITATQWEETALSLRARVLDMELRRLDASTKIHQLLGDESLDDVAPKLDLRMLPTWAVDVADAVENHAEVLAATKRVERARLAIEQAEARRRPDVALSGFAGYGAADASVRGQRSSGAFGIYGLAVRLSYTIRDPRGAAELSRARRELARVTAERDAITRRVRTALTAQMLRIDAQRRRIDLLTQAVELANRRHESLVRLAAAGVQSDFEALVASAESLARESRLDDARIDQWKAWQRLRRLLPPSTTTAVLTAMVDVARYAMP